MSAAALVLVGLWGGPQPLDDSLITLRYARSLAEGDGFVFNTGERVLGTTTPLFTLLLAAAHRISGLDLIWLAYVAACVGHVGTAAMLVIIGRRCESAFAGWLAACLFGLAPLALHASVGCMETSLFVLATLCALDPSEDPGQLWRSGAATAALLLRPEGVLPAALHIVGVARHGRRATLRAAACIAVGSLPWLAFATWYFGSPLPQSMLAKWSSHAFLPRWLVAENFWYLLISLPIAAPKIEIAAFTAQPFGALIANGLWPSIDPAIGRVAVLLFGALILAVVCTGGVALVRRNPRILPLCLFVVVYIAAYCWARPPLFPWYLVPPLPVLLLAFTVGGGVLLHAVLGRWQEPAAAVLAAGLIGLAAWQGIRYVRAFPPTPRIHGYRTALDMLGPAAQDPAVLVGALEIGALGYYSRARILDHAGLISPDVIALGTNGTVEHYQPAYYIGFQLGFTFGGFYQAPAFTNGYDLVGRIAAKSHDGSMLLVYRRRGAGDIQR